MRQSTNVPLFLRYFISGGDLSIEEEGAKIIDLEKMCQKFEYFRSNFTEEVFNTDKRINGFAANLKLFLIDKPSSDVNKTLESIGNLIRTDPALMDIKSLFKSNDRIAMKILAKQVASVKTLSDGFYDRIKAFSKFFTEVCCF